MFASYPMTEVSDPDIAARSQKLRFDAGCEAKDDWVYIDDLVQRYRERCAGCEEMVRDVDEFLANITVPVTRAGFERYCAKAQQQFQAQQVKEQQRARLADICAQVGVIEPGAEHEALALRIDELEKAVESYAERLKAAEQTAPKHSAGSFWGLLVFSAISDGTQS